MRFAEPTRPKQGSPESYRDPSWTSPIIARFPSNLFHAPKHCKLRIIDAVRAVIATPVLRERTLNSEASITSPSNRTDRFGRKQRYRYADWKFRHWTSRSSNVACEPFDARCPRKHAPGRGLRARTAAICACIGHFGISLARQIPVSSLHHNSCVELTFWTKTAGQRQFE